MVEYDPKYVDRPPVHKRPVHRRAVDWIAGEFPSAKPAMNFRMVRYDGMLSRQFILVLESDPHVLTYWEKPAEFQWTDGLRSRPYTPDFAVELDDGRRIGVEVKWLKFVKKSGFLKRLPHIRRAALKSDYHDFELWTEEEIESQPRLANENLLAFERRSFVVDQEAVHRMRVVLREIGGRGTVRQLRAASGLGRQAFRTIVRLVALGELRLTRPDLPLDDYAFLEIPNR